MTAWRWALLLIAAAWPGSSGAEDLLAHGKKRTVMISYDFTDNKTGAIKRATGSGVVISDEGHVLTAFHVVKPWMDQTDAEKDKNPVWGAVGGKYNPKVQLLGPSSREQDPGDFAVFQIGSSPPPGGHLPASICYVRFSEVPESKFVAFGYPLGSEIQPVEGLFGNASGPALTWSASTSFVEGMSGGPVFDKRGFLIGLIRSGLKPPVQFVTPIAFANSAMVSNSIKVPSTCTSPLQPSPVFAAAPSESFKASLKPALPLATVSKISDQPASIKPRPSGCRAVAFTDKSRTKDWVEMRTICFD